MKAEYLTAQGLADALQCSVRTVYRRLKENPNVATLHDGKIVRFRVSDYVRECNKMREEREREKERLSQSG